jgi:hypothetical protein
MSAQASLPAFHNVLPLSEGHPTPDLPKTNEGIRVCQVIQLRPEALAEYKKCHQAVFPGVLKALRRSGVVGTSLQHFNCASSTKTDCNKSRLLDTSFRASTSSLGDSERSTYRTNTSDNASPGRSYAVHKERLIGRV